MTEESTVTEETSVASEETAATEETVVQEKPVYGNVSIEELEAPEYSEDQFNEMMALYEDSISGIQEGQIVQGTVASIGPSEVLVDIGFKSEGVVPIREFNDPQAIEIGQEIEVFLESVEDQEGQVVLSKQKADFMRVWDTIKDAHDTGNTVQGRLMRRIKGGIVVDLFGVDAFLPGSQIDIRQVKNFDQFIGQEFPFKIIKLNKARRNIVVSRRAVLEEEREKMRAELIQELEEDQVREGVVKNITDFGAFIDLGGLDGLLHKSDMSWGRVSHPADFVERDQEIDVMVLSINRESGKVSLGLKQLTKDPWEGIADKFPVASDAVGRVVNIVDYGAFVELEEGVEGLVHVSEMSWTRRNIDPHTVLGVGDEVTVRILNVDPDRQKISLGLKQLAENPWDRLERDKPVGARVAGRVRNITDFGVFVEIEEGIDGLIHVSDLSWTKRVEPDEMLQEGAEIEVVILDVDRDRERVSLGLKQLEPDPWLDVPEKYKVGTTVEAQIVNLTNFGAFAKLEDGIEGLIHISELSDQHVEDPIEVVRVGDSLDVKVINLDLQDRRIGLSRKAYIADQHRTEAVEQDAPTPVAPTAAPARPQPQPRGREREQERERPRERSAGGTTLGDLIDQAQRDLTDDDDGDSDDEE